MQRTKPGQRKGYAGRRLDARDRAGAGPQPSRPGAVATGRPYGVRVRNMGVGDWATLVKKMRDATKMTGAELSRRLNVDRATIWRWESGRQRPEDPNKVKEFAELFGLDVEDVLRIAGLRPAGEPVGDVPAPMDPDLEALLAMLRDPDTPDSIKLQIRTMLRAITELAESLPPRRAPDMRREA